MLRGQARKILHWCMSQGADISLSLKPPVILCINATGRGLASQYSTLNTAGQYGTARSHAGFDDYEKEVAYNFENPLSIPDNYNYSLDVVDEWARKEENGERMSKMPAFWWVGCTGREVKWSFSQIRDKSRRVTQLLKGDCDLQAGDRVMVLLPKVPEWWLISIGAWRAGIVLVPGTLQLTPRDIMKRLQQSQAKCIFVDQDTAEKVDSILHECPDVKTKVVVAEDQHLAMVYSKSGWKDFKTLYNHTEMTTYPTIPAHRSKDDPMTVFFTSGTTGMAKMTLHTHASYGAAHAITGKYWMDQAQDDLYWVLSDTGWAKAAWFVAPWIQGAGIFVHEMPAFSPYDVLRALDSYPVTSFCAPPTAYRLLLQCDLTKYHWKNCRHFLSAGEPLNPEVIDNWRNVTGQFIREGYGQTESVIQCGMFRCLPLRPGSMGKPAPGMDLTIIDHECNEIHGHEGDFAIKVNPYRPAGLFVEYLDEPERTEKCYRGDYYITGDRGYKDEDGYFWFVGRADDVIISSGYRIGPFEVESALLEHHLVVESAVVSSPDEIRGEVVKAFIVLTEEGKANFVDKALLVQEIQEHVKKITAAYKYPRKIEFVNELPKTVSGKIRRIELRQNEWAGHSSQKS